MLTVGRVIYGVNLTQIIGSEGSADLYDLTNGEHSGKIDEKTYDLLVDAIEFEEDGFLQYYSEIGDVPHAFGVEMGEFQVKEMLERDALISMSEVTAEIDEKYSDLVKGIQSKKIKSLIKKLPSKCFILWATNN